METFKTIETMRNKNGFPEKNYSRYKNYLKVEMRRPASKDIRSVYKLESNLSKFFMLNSVRFLKNNLRILRKEKSQFSDVYETFIIAIIGSITGNPMKIDTLLKLREQVLPFRSFLIQVDLLIEAPEYNFDLSSLKAKLIWNDIEVGFDTVSEKNAFLENRIAPQGDEYDAVLARQILKVEKRRDQLFSLIKSKPSKIVCINRKIEKFLEALNTMNNFLHDNLVESAHIDQVIKNTEELGSYYSKVKDFVQFVRWDESIDSFTVPSMFEAMKSYILRAREDISLLSKKHTQNAIFGYLEKAFKPKEPTINVPFIPMIFDIAADYISYPAEDKKISELFKKIQISK